MLKLVLSKVYLLKKKKTNGDKTTPAKWRQIIIESTKKYAGIAHGEVKMEVIFFFDPSQFPKDLPYGPDLDNYLKSLLDHLNETVFSSVAGKDSCVKRLIASKHKAKNTGGVGVKINIWEI